MFDLNPSQKWQCELAQIKLSLYFSVLHHFSALSPASTSPISIDETFFQPFLLYSQCPEFSISRQNIREKYWTFKHIRSDNTKWYKKIYEYLLCS